MWTFSVYLASQSPRRRELLAQIGVAHRVLSVDIDEGLRRGELPADYVQRLAREKAAVGWQDVVARGLERAPVIGADTAVVIDGDILGKPADEAAAIAMLERLAGRSHEVMTGVAVHAALEEQVAMSCTRVWFRALDRAEIEAYW
ncbi:MAG TPA: nucleoside triphosphate pyrophosphatase, partial [Spongiibacteraceae bacterium]|nr:nucleoside triphosphate pyrophosphatase [Spongiibacteraceae bacterium]